MSGVAKPPWLDPEFPGLRPEVVAAWRGAPEHAIHEVIDGELFTQPRPRRQHLRASGELHGELRGPFDRGVGGPGGWVILDEPELRVGELPDILVPDLAGWRRERIPEDFLAEDAPAFIALPPDWVCEVLSPRTEASDRGGKMRIYRREGVAHVWLVDPLLKTLEVYRWERGLYTLVDTWEGDAPVRAEPFDAIALNLRALWTL
ncbi:MAG: Uma2 family endonuclease [Polyangiales bacterium]